MALNQIARVRGSLKCYCRYDCRKCGGTQVGESFEVIVDTHDVANILNDRIAPRPHAQPVGWASFLDGNGNTVFQCTACNEKETGS